MSKVRERLWLPDKRLVHGHGVVELHDALTGKLQQREPFDNFVSAIGLERLSWEVRNALHTGMPSGATVETAAVYPFDQLVATDYDGAEAPTTEAVLKGRIVAFADKTVYAGSNNKRGTCTAAECVADATKAKWVFDWPTTSGNGTIESLCWVALPYTSVEAPGTLMRYVWQLATPGTVANSIGYGLDVQGGKILGVTHTSGGGQAYGHTWDLDGTNPTAVSIATSTGHQPRYITADGTDFYWWDSEGNDFAKAPLAGGAPTVLNATLAAPSDLTSDGTNIFGLYAGEIRQLSKVNGSTLATIAIPVWDGFTLSSQSGLAWDAGRSVFWINFGTITYNAVAMATFTGWIIAMDASGVFHPEYGIFYSEKIIGGATSDVTGLGFVGNDANGEPKFVSKSNSGNPGNGYGYLAEPVGLGARTLLGAPVTKANTQTMKVTYQFDFS